MKPVVRPERAYERQNRTHSYLEIRIVSQSMHFVCATSLAHELRCRANQSRIPPARSGQTGLDWAGPPVFIIISRGLVATPRWPNDELVSNMGTVRSWHARWLRCRAGESTAHCARRAPRSFGESLGRPA